MSGKINKIFKEELENILKEQEESKPEDQNYDDGCDGSLDDDCDYQTSELDRDVERLRAMAGDPDAMETAPVSISAGEGALTRKEIEKLQKMAMDEFARLMSNIKRPEGLDWIDESIIGSFFTIGPDKKGSVAFFADNDTIRKIKTAIKDARCRECVEAVRKRRALNQSRPSWHILKDLVSQMKKQFPYMEEKHFLSDRGLKAVAENMWGDMKVSAETTYKDFPKDYPLDPLSVLALDNESYKKDFDKKNAQYEAGRRAGRATRKIWNKTKKAKQMGTLMLPVGSLFERNQLNEYIDARTDGMPIGINSLPSGLTLIKLLKTYEKEKVAKLKGEKIREIILWEAKKRYQSQKISDDIYNLVGMVFLVTTLVIPWSLAVGSAGARIITHQVARRAGGRAASRLIGRGGSTVGLGQKFASAMDGVLLFAVEMIVLEAAFGWKGFKQMAAFFTERRMAISSHVNKLKILLENISERGEIKVREIKQLKHSLAEIKRNALELKKGLITYSTLTMVDLRIGKQGSLSRKGSKLSQINSYIERMESAIKKKEGTDDFSSLDDEITSSLTEKEIERFSEAYLKYINFYFEVSSGSERITGQDPKGSDFSRNIPKGSLNENENDYLGGGPVGELPKPAGPDYRNKEDDSEVETSAFPDDSRPTDPMAANFGRKEEEMQSKIKDAVDKILQDIEKPKDLTWFQEVCFRNFLSIGPDKGGSFAIALPSKVEKNIEKVRISSYQTVEQRAGGRVGPVKINLKKAPSSNDQVKGPSGRDIPEAELLQRHMFNMRAGMKKAFPNMSEGDLLDDKQLMSAFKAIKQQVITGARDWRDVDPICVVSLRSQNGMVGGLNISSQVSLASLVKKTHLELSKKRRSFARDSLLWVAKKIWQKKKAKEDLYFWISVSLLAVTLIVPWSIGVIRGLQAIRAGAASASLGTAGKAFLWLGESLIPAMAEIVIMEMVFDGPMIKVIGDMINKRTNHINNHITVIRSMIKKIESSGVISELEIKQIEKTMEDLSRLSREHMEGILGIIQRKDFEVSKSYNMSKTRIKLALERYKKSLEKQGLTSIQVIKGSEKDYKSIKLSPINKKFLSHLKTLLDYYQSFLKDAMPGGTGSFSRIMPKDTFKTPDYNRDIAHDSIKENIMTLNESRPANSVNEIEFEFLKVICNDASGKKVRGSQLLEIIDIINKYDFSVDSGKIVKNTNNTGSALSSARSKSKSDGRSITRGIATGHVQAINSNPSESWIKHLPGGHRLQTKMRPVILFADPENGFISRDWFTLYAGTYVDSASKQISESLTFGFCKGYSGAMVPVAFDSLYDTSSIIQGAIRNFYYFQFLVKPVNGVKVRELTPGWPKLSFSNRAAINNLMTNLNAINLKSLNDFVDQLHPNHQNSILIHNGKFENKPEDYKRKIRRLYSKMAPAVGTFSALRANLNRKLESYLDAPSENTFNSMLPELFILHSIQTKMVGRF